MYIYYCFNFSCNIIWSSTSSVYDFLERINPRFIIWSWKIKEFQIVIKVSCFVDNPVHNSLHVIVSLCLVFFYLKYLWTVTHYTTCFQRGGGGVAKEGMNREWGGLEWAWMWKWGKGGGLFQALFESINLNG